MLVIVTQSSSSLYRRLSKVLTLHRPTRASFSHIIPTRYTSNSWRNRPKRGNLLKETWTKRQHETRALIHRFQIWIRWFCMSKRDLWQKQTESTWKLRRNVTFWSKKDTSTEKSWTLSKIKRFNNWREGSSWRDLIRPEPYPWLTRSTTRNSSCNRHFHTSWEVKWLERFRCKKPYT